MTYDVGITPTASKEYRRLEPETQRRVARALRQLPSQPRPPGTVKLRGSDRDWRLRVGSYRILYEIDDEANQVTVWRIAHRKHVYR